LPIGRLWKADLRGRFLIGVNTQPASAIGLMVFAVHAMRRSGQKKNNPLGGIP